MPSQNATFQLANRLNSVVMGNKHSGESCQVIDYKHVLYNGERWSLTALAKYLTGVTGAIAGPRYFKYKGEWLNSIRERAGV